MKKYWDACANTRNKKDISIIEEMTKNRENGNYKKFWKRINVIQLTSSWQKIHIGVKYQADAHLLYMHIDEQVSWHVRQHIQH